MLNVGLIGNTEILEPYVTKIKKNSEINVIGKASIGRSAQLNSFHFSIPEFNRVELIERADVILMDNSTPMPYKFMRDIVVKSKHIFCTEYPDLTIEECSELNKLINESRSVVQVRNPYYFTPAIQWMNKNISTPAFIDYSNFERNILSNNPLYPMLLMLLGTTGISPKKIGAVTFPGYNNSTFTNVRLEFGDASVVNLNYGNLESLKNFKVRIYSDNQFATFNFTKDKYLCDNKEIEIEDLPKTDELDVFVDSILGKTKKISTLEDYLIAMHVAQKITKKIAQFSTH
jgi:predicted dehydrogenase